MVTGMATPPAASVTILSLSCHFQLLTYLCCSAYISTSADGHRYGNTTSSLCHNPVTFLSLSVTHLFVLLCLHFHLCWWSQVWQHHQQPLSQSSHFPVTFSYSPVCDALPTFPPLLMVTGMVTPPAASVTILSLSCHFQLLTCLCCSAYISTSADGHRYGNTTSSLRHNPLTFLSLSVTHLFVLLCLHFHLCWWSQVW